MGGRDQSQVKNIKVFEKKLSPFRKDVPKSHNDDNLIHSNFISPLCLLLGMVRAQDLP